MTTDNNDTTDRDAAARRAVELTPQAINEIYEEASRLRAEALHDGTVRAFRIAKRAIVAVYRALFTSEARRHA
ncbi:MAG: hypothetical protein ABJ215_07740 [Alphaproteobacteria bacterium]